MNKIKKNNNVLYLILIGVVILAGHSLVTQETSTIKVSGDAMSAVTSAVVSVNVPSSSNNSAISTMKDTYMQRPNSVPRLREYNTDSTKKILHASNPTSYIIPSNEWVRYYASLLYIDDNGVVKYKGDIYMGKGYDEVFINYYSTDEKLFFKSDYWQNVDYYLANGMMGDCEDYAMAVTSMMLSGEMSIVQNNIYVKTVIPAKAVIGYTNYLSTSSYRDMWVEYRAYNKTFISTTGLSASKDSLTLWLDEPDFKYFRPVFEFDNKSFRQVS